MKILIIGLGIMGASYASKLTRLGHRVYGHDINPKMQQAAVSQNLIVDANYLTIIDQMDLVLITLYPKDTISFLIEHEKYLTNNQVITDIAGVKTNIMEFVLSNFKFKNRYISHHPMAGREKQSTFFYDEKMFENANCILIDNQQADQEACLLVTKLLSTFGFKKIIQTTPYLHDKLVGYTSQLTHAIALALVKANTEDLTFSATGDSFRDLTRIAKINENLWNELFFENKNILIEEIKHFSKVLNDLQKHLENNDQESVKEYMRDGHDKRKKYD